MLNTLINEFLAKLFVEKNNVQVDNSSKVIKNSGVNKNLSKTKN